MVKLCTLEIELADICGYLNTESIPVVDERGGGPERVPALRAEVGLDARVRHHVDLALLLPRERLLAHPAREGPLT